MSMLLSLELRRCFGMLAWYDGPTGDMLVF